MSFIAELKRRNVLRVGAAYIVTSWLLIQVAETIFPLYGFGDAPARTVVTLLVVGFVPVLILAWAFEWTPEGIKKESEVDRAKSVTATTGKKLDRIIMVVLAMALGYFAFDKFVLAPQKAERELAEAREEGRSDALVESFGDASIAVLAFDDMSPGKDQAYLSDGISEEILNLLARIPEIRVISRSSAFSYKGSNTPVTQIAEELDVAHVLEGSVRKDGDRIRITAQLIDGRSDTHLWSRSYDRDLVDIFAIQDEIAAAMVEEMTITLLGDVPKSGRPDPDAYLLTLRGQHFLNLFQRENALAVFQEATELDPDYAEAWLGLSNTFWTFSSTINQGLSIQPERDEFALQAIAAWDRAAQLDPDHPSVAVARIRDSFQQLDYVQAARQIERALELHPANWDVVNLAMGFARHVTRQVGIAKTLGAMAVARDPFCSRCRLMYGRTLMVARDYPAAIRELNQARSLISVPGGELNLGTSKLMIGDPQGALELFQLRGWEEEREWGRLIVRITTGDLDGIEAELAAFESRFWSSEIEWRNRNAALLLAELYASLGDIENGFKWLAEYERNSTPSSMAFLWHDEFLVNLQGDPRWRALEARIGVAPEQLAKIGFDPKLPGVEPALEPGSKQ